MQAYLRDSEHDLLELIAWARKAGRPLVVRLVKGAYWTSRRPYPASGLPVPSGPRSPRATQLREAHGPPHGERGHRLAGFASHNVRSCAHAIAQADRRGIDRGLRVPGLYGWPTSSRLLSSPPGTACASTARGRPSPGMAYLVRRLLENTSNEGFLRAKDVGAHPGSAAHQSGRASQGGEGWPGARRHPGFRNAPNTDFSQEKNRARMREASPRSARTRRKHPL